MSIKSSIVRCKDCRYSSELSEEDKRIFRSECLKCTLYSSNDHTVAKFKDDFCGDGFASKADNLTNKEIVDQC